MKRMKVLIAESNPSVRQFIRYTMEEHFPQFEFEVATNGKNIKKRLLETKFDLIIYESEMPMLSGDELLEWRTEQDRIKSVPVVIMSSDRREESLKTAIRLGANAYLIKPLLMEHIVSKIREIMGKQNRNPKDRRRSDRIKTEGTVTVKFDNKVCRGNLINVSSGGILGIFNRKDGLPRILDKVEVDLEMDSKQSLQGLTAVVIRIQAVDTVTGLDYIQLVVKFDNTIDPKKKEEFRSVLSTLQRGALT
ncbi:MAG: response regulator [Nitrospiraceae bacterium]|nr:MAG: response regulator [Nitrospiraceae bacterium]